MYVCLLELNTDTVVSGNIQIFLFHYKHILFIIGQFSCTSFPDNVMHDKKHKTFLSASFRQIYMFSSKYAFFITTY